MREEDHYISSEPEELDAIEDEDELAQLVEVASKQQRLRQMRDYLRAVERGDNTIQPPPILRPQRLKPELTAQPAQSDHAFEMPVIRAKFKGESAAEFTRFKHALNSAFFFSNQYLTDQAKTVYASGWLEGAARRRWVAYLRIYHNNDPSQISYQEFLEWCEGQITDPNTTAFAAMLRLDAIRQGEDEPFAKFLERYEEVEIECPGEISDQIRAILLLIHMKETLRQEVVRSGVPITKENAIQVARRVELLQSIVIIPKTIPKIDSQRLARSQ